LLYNIKGLRKEVINKKNKKKIFKRRCEMKYNHPSKRGNKIKKGGT